MHLCTGAQKVIMLDEMQVQIEKFFLAGKQQTMKNNKHYASLIVFGQPITKHKIFRHQSASIKWRAPAFRDSGTSKNIFNNKFPVLLF